LSIKKIKNGVMRLRFSFYCTARVGIWFYPLVVDWMDVSLNVSLQSIIRKGWTLNKMVVNLAHVTRENSVVSAQYPVKTFGL